MEQFKENFIFNDDYAFVDDGTIVPADKRRAVSRHLGLKFEPKYKEDLMLVLLLHSEFITVRQANICGFNTSGGDSDFFKKIKDKGFIRSFQLRKGSSRSDVYTLTQKGINHINNNFSGIITKNCSFKSNRKAPKNLNHFMAVRDLYFALISNPLVPDFDIEYEVFVDIKSDTDSSLKYLKADARLLIDDKIYWIEQDMSTERGRDLMLKAKRMRHAETYPDGIIFIITPLEYATRFNLTQTQDTLGSTISVLKKQLKFMKENNISSINDGLEQLKILSTQENLHKNARIGFKKRYMTLVSHMKTRPINSLGSLIEEIELLSFKRKSMVDYNDFVMFSEAYNKRLLEIYAYLFERPKIHDSFEYFAYKGLNVFYLSNKYIDTFANRDFVGCTPMLEQVKRYVEQFRNAALENYISISRLSIGTGTMDIANIFDDFITIEFVYLDLCALNRVVRMVKSFDPNDCKGFVHILVFSTMRDVDDFIATYDVEKFHNSNTVLLFTIAKDINLLYKQKFKSRVSIFLGVDDNKNKYIFSVDDLINIFN